MRFDRTQEGVGMAAGARCAFCIDLALFEKVMSFQLLHTDDFAVDLEVGVFVIRTRRTGEYKTA